MERPERSKSGCPIYNLLLCIASKWSRAAYGRKRESFGRSELSRNEKSGEQTRLLLDVALKEYDNLLRELETHLARMWASATTVVTTLTLFAGYLNLSNPPEPAIPRALAWAVVPPFILGMLSFIMYLFYQTEHNRYLLRAVADRIVRLMGGDETAILHFNRDIPSGKYMSTHSGGIALRFLFNVMVVLLSVLVGYIIFLCYQSARSDGPRYGTLFIAIYLPILIFEVILFLPIRGEMRDVYESQRKRIQIGESLKTSREEFVSRSAIMFHILPRQYDVFKWLYFVYGFLLGYLWYVDDGNSRINLINDLFAPSNALWRTISEVPFLWLALFAGLCMLVQEYLLQQGKLIWDDIRDLDRDKKIEGNKSRRALVTGKISLRMGFLQMGVRWIGGLVLGLVLGIDYFILFLLISVHQVIYELHFKPSARTKPVQMLLWAGLTVPMRVFGGMSVIAPISVFSLPNQLTFSVFYLSAVGGLATIWWREAESDCDAGKNPVREQGSFYLDNGQKWQLIGLSASLLVSLAAVVLAFNYPNWFVLKLDLYSRDTLLFLAMNLVVTTASFGTAFRFWRIINAGFNIITRSKWFKYPQVLITVLFVGTFLYAMPVLKERNANVLFLVLFALYYLLDLKNKTYEQIMLLGVGEKLKTHLVNLYYYLFNLHLDC